MLYIEKKNVLFLAVKMYIRLNIFFLTFLIMKIGIKY